jgi:hypothetical protein
VTGTRITTDLKYQWYHEAACRDMPKEWFYDYELGLHHRGLSKMPDKVPDKVVEVCTTCPVKDSCLEHALKVENFGYWANTTPGDRRKLRKRLGIRLSLPQDLLAEGMR